MTQIHRPARPATRAASFRYGGRHHSGIPGDIIPLYPGDFVGIRRNLSIARSGETQLHLHKAAALLEHATATVKQQHPEYSRIEIAGDFRIGSELVTDLALVAETRKPSESEEISGGLKLALTDKKHYGAKLLHATGSAEHLKQLVALAHDKGLELRPDGLYRGKKLIASATEK